MRFFLCLALLLLTTLSCRKHTSEAGLFPIKGIDVSHFQRRVDWAKVARDSSLHFVFIKATEAKNMEDSLFDINWKALAKTRLLRGAYHYFRPDAGPELQVANFVTSVNLKSGDLPPVLDVEKDGGLSPTELRQKITIWLQLIENRYNVKPIIYTGENFYHKYFDGFFTQYNFWIARYYYRKPTSPFTFWQYSSSGHIDGTSEEVDLDVFAGTLDDLHKLCIK